MKVIKIEFYFFFFKYNVRSHIIFCLNNNCCSHYRGVVLIDLGSFSENCIYFVCRIGKLSLILFNSNWITMNIIFFNGLPFDPCFRRPILCHPIYFHIFLLLFTFRLDCAIVCFIFKISLSQTFSDRLSPQ